MSLRWRETGELLCAAKCSALADDTYIDDRLHYQLSQELKVIAPDRDEEHNGLWHWLDPLFNRNPLPVSDTPNSGAPGQVGLSPQDRGGPDTDDQAAPGSTSDSEPIPAKGKTRYE